MIILVDTDGVIADFVQGYTARWKSKGYPGLDEWTHWRVERHIPDDHHHLVEPVMCEKGLFRGLPVIPGSQAAIQEMRSDGHKVLICSTPTAADHCTTEKVAWLREHFGSEIARNAIFTQDKTIVHGDLLIDDRPEITGLIEPRWQRVVFDQVYNRHVTNHRRLSRWEDWREVVDSTGGPGE